MPVAAIVVLALIAAIVTAFSVAFAWTQMHARPAGSLPAPIANRPRRRPF
jgi:hypothetical protein